jgi:hypothetical protein
MNKVPLCLLFLLGANIFVSTTNAVKLNQLRPSLKLPFRQNSDFDCGFCEFIVSFIYGYLTTNSTESEIVHTVDGICNYVSGSVETVVFFCPKAILNSCSARVLLTNTDLR